MASSNDGELQFVLATDLLHVSGEGLVLANVHFCLRTLVALLKDLIGDVVDLVVLRYNSHGAFGSEDVLHITNDLRKQFWLVGQPNATVVDASALGAQDECIV